MLSGLLLVLAGAAVVAGVTGAWSPCGFSMVDTLGTGARHAGRSPARLLAPACGAFAAGAVAGGAALFGGLAALGHLLGAGGNGVGRWLAVVVAAAAALAELRGVRIRPQVRRQVPEAWRRIMPLPVAAGLYGVLLGLGFATFVLTLAVAALAAVVLMLGDAATGLLVGAAFGLGRAIPVVALAPVHDRPVGLHALELMAERPAALRGMRAVDGVALAMVAAALGAGTAHAAARVASPATDPTAATGWLAWQQPGGPGVVVGGGRTTSLPGTDPALGGPFLAWRNGDAVTVAQRETLAPVLTRAVPGVSKLALSARWLAWRRALPTGGDAIEAIDLAAPDRVLPVASSQKASRLGRPNLDGDRLAYHLAGRDGSAIHEVNLATGSRSVILRSRDDELLNPSLLGDALLYVRISRCSQRLVLRRLGRRRVLFRGRALAGTDAGHERGHTR